MTATEINVREKRAELLALWERMFRLCEAQVTKMEQGEIDLTASMLKELNAFMKQSAVTLVELEKAQEADAAKATMEYADESPSEPEGDADEDGWDMPFPTAGATQEPAQEVSQETVENPMAVPLEY